ncbi:hypothetical protein EPK99_17060 [Neorhizobium lilium]|uniref:Uncharacterized protein n=1 Tax=Neorhizobium lilium TaxID=2503024 RepID=A0A3S3REB4_9HYPH|nr:hypothetical protein [Neorhizobium lilium]RWX75415.1 hypothetical protein EPK99_17060 [Neorhizobium lilium]
MEDLTLTEAVTDPLIRVMLEADGIDTSSFATSLENAKRRFIDQGIERLRQERAEHFYRWMDDRLQ